MKYQELVILLPCHSLEDFPIHHEGEEADGLMAGWTVLWHPALIAAAEHSPTWMRVDDPPTELEDRLIVIPKISHQELPTGFPQRAKDEGGVVLRNEVDRDKMLAQALEPLEGGDAGVDADLAADFLALGYCYLQVELLTRQMRYSSNLDEVHFNNLVVQAAQAAVQGDLDQARERLASSFDLLAEERDHYYAVENSLLNLLLVAPTTIGAELRDELAVDQPVNLLINQQTLDCIAAEEPETLSALKSAIAEGRAAIVGGELVDLPWPLLSVESMLRDWRSAHHNCKQLLDADIHAYGRRRHGLTPMMPQILLKMGCEGAFHASLDEGRVPEGSQIKTRWEGADGASIDALTRTPVDASNSGAYLGLALKLGETMDTDHVATMVFAHWPGQASVWREDLRRIAKYGNALGRFQRIDEFFRDTDLPGHLDRFEADQYSSPYLKQAVIRRQADPLSSIARYWKRRGVLEAIEALRTLSILAGKSDNASSQEELDDFAQRIDQAVEGEEAGLDEKLTARLQEQAEGFAAAVPRSGDPEAGCLAINPCSFVRRVAVDTNLQGGVAVERPVYATTADSQGRHVVVDLPPMGYAWLSSGTEKRLRKPVLIADPEPDQFSLRNEFFEAVINPVTGSLQALYEYKSRGNRFSQQLGFRLPRSRAAAAEQLGADTDAAYSVMAADSVQVTRNTTSVGEIVAKGRLLDREGTELATFEQRYELARGSRVLRLQVTLDPKTEPRSDPWNSYYACRFAWADETDVLWRAANQTRQRAESKRFEAPHYIEIENGDSNVTVLCGGLPYHRRTDYRMLDTLLHVRGERQRTFDLGIGVDLKHPMHEAMSLLSPPVLIPQTAPPPSPNHSWLFHIDARNVVSTHWAPMYENQQVVGVRLRLLETAGRPARLKLDGFRGFASAKQLDFCGKSLGDCAIEEGRACIELTAHEWIEVEARWSEK